ncbi:MAG TPA: hypothetical protein VHS59_13930 [Bacillota bacterium]|nr:hypothetical protein [Bacillota bacterium]
MNIKFTLNAPYMTKQDVRKLVKEMEIFCACGFRISATGFNEQVICPECGLEYHLQEGTGHFHVIINKPTEPTYE